MKKATISDVADAADVSKSTVSRVMNGATNVDPEMRERVLAAVKQLDYQPSRAARTLKKNLQDVVGFLVPSLADTIFGAVIQGAQDYAYENQMGILPYSTADDLKRQQQYIDGLLSEQVAGLVVVPAPGTDPDVLRHVQDQDIPIVMLDRKLHALDADYIGSDNTLGAYEAVRHLLDNGYRRIATIAGAADVTTGIERLNGYRVAMTEAEITIQPGWIQYGNFDAETTYQALKTLIALEQPPDAVFIGNDAMTVSGLRAIRDLNICIPDDLAVVGFDEIPMADLLSPSLTTVAQVPEMLGQEALRLLFERIQHKHDPRPTRTVLIPTRLHIRESSAARS